MHDDFKFMNDSEKKIYYDQWVDSIISYIHDNKGNYSNTVIAKIEKALVNNNWSTELINHIFNTKFADTDISIIDIDSKTQQFKTDNSNENRIIVFYCNEYYYPLIHMYSEPHSKEVFSKINNKYSKN